MKKIFLTILISILVGGSFAFIIYKNVDQEVKLAINEEDIVTFFQVGVFKNEENANSFMQNFNSSIIIKDKDYYRVIIAILKDEEAILKEKAYFDSLGISYYLKKETVSNLDFTTKLQEYEQMLINASNETYNKINQDILKLYEGVKK